MDEEKRGGAMLARIWDGATEARRADEYVEYLRRTGVADSTSTEGNRGVYVLRREDGPRTSFRFFSLWESMDAVRRFAGPEPERARYYPEDERFLLTLQSGVEHFEVVIGNGGGGSVAEGAALAEELRTLWRGDPWHGPSLEDILGGVTAEQAAARPVRAGHSIWELVAHVTAWAGVWRRRLEGQRVGDPEEGDFPPVPEPTAEAWTRARARLREAHERLVERVARLTPQELGTPVPGRDYDARFLVRGAIRHTVYHSGQIALLKKAG
jgi:uncharacterized damage-inducible protein DinB/heme-degrading monooxygenase HmoA